MIALALALKLFTSLLGTALSVTGLLGLLTFL